jgi:hypothetical protein
MTDGRWPNNEDEGKAGMGIGYRTLPGPPTGHRPSPISHPQAKLPGGSHSEIVGAEVGAGKAGEKSAPTDKTQWTQAPENR